MISLSMSSVRHNLIWSLSLWLLSSPFLINQGAGSRSLVNHSGYQSDLVVDLNVTNFKAVLKDSPATYAIVEFYAHWSPASVNYKPHYEKVASLFNGIDAVYPGIVLVTRVDCAIKVNTNLCDKFSVSRYPMVFWGTPYSFIAGSLDGKMKKSEIRVDDARTAPRLLNWINTELGSSYTFKNEIVYDLNNELLQSNVSDHAQHDI